MAGNLIRQMKIQDGVSDSLLAQVNSIKELKVADSSLATLQASSITLQTSSLSVNNASYLQLIDIETAIQAVETNQTDKSQFTQITDGTETLLINASGEALVYDTDTLSKLGDIETNQTDKSQMTMITNGTIEAGIVAAADDTTNLEDANGLVVNAVLNGRISNTAIKPLRIDSATQTLQTITYEHHEIHAGSHYMCCDYVDLAINEVYDIQITTPNTTSWAHLTFRIEPQSETLIEIYENVTINLAGTAEPVRNNDRNSLNNSGLTVNGILNTSTANANADTAIAAATAIEAGIVGSGKGSMGADAREREIILKQNEDYTLRFTANAAGYINYCLEWYEHTNKN